MRVGETALISKLKTKPTFFTMRRHFYIHALLVMSVISCSSSSDESEKLPIDPPTPEPPALEYEWDLYDIPVAAAAGEEWVLQESSDEFNYDAPATDKGAEFAKRWSDFYHNDWSGPAPTVWQRDHVWVADGMLQIKASRPEGVESVTVTSGTESKQMPATYTGCITSKERVSYPAYVEAYAKLSKSTMASDVWMLSPDDTQEIDIIEAYGGDRDTGANGKKFYGADRLHLSHHVFVRDPFQDYQPTDGGSWYTDNRGTLWRDDFHRIGVYWRDPFHLEYYVDGKRVRVVTGESIIDPKGFTDGTGLNKDLDIIINMEDQSWRALGGLSPTDAELENEADCTFKVDWIRVYKLVEK